VRAGRVQHLETGVGRPLEETAEIMPVRLQRAAAEALTSCVRGSESIKAMVSRR
jgi:hypothetical protein